MTARCKPATGADGRGEAAWNFHDAKVWSPHTEALYACLLAYDHTRDIEFLSWRNRVHEYSYNLFPDLEHGEWRQRFDRQGRPITDVVALPVKAPFHLPRALIYCVDVLERLHREQTGPSLVCDCPIGTFLM